jgi:hypothetical protein
MQIRQRSLLCAGDKRGQMCFIVDIGNQSMDPYAHPSPGSFALSVRGVPPTKVLIGIATVQSEKYQTDMGNI